MEKFAKLLRRAERAQGLRTSGGQRRALKCAYARLPGAMRAVASARLRTLCS